MKELSSSNLVGLELAAEDLQITETLLQLVLSRITYFVIREADLWLEVCENLRKQLVFVGERREQAVTLYRGLATGAMVELRVALEEFLKMFSRRSTTSAMATNQILARGVSRMPNGYLQLKMIDNLGSHVVSDQTLSLLSPGITILAGDRGSGKSSTLA